jgi:hypothetical protein
MGMRLSRGAVVEYNENGGIVTIHSNCAEDFDPVPPVSQIEPATEKVNPPAIRRLSRSSSSSEEETADRGASAGDYVCDD